MSKETTLHARRLPVGDSCALFLLRLRRWLQVNVNGLLRAALSEQSLQYLIQEV
jgi:hypothetical protein